MERIKLMNSHRMRKCKRCHEVFEKYPVPSGWASVCRPCKVKYANGGRPRKERAVL